MLGKFITAQEVSEFISRARQEPASWLDIDADQMSARYNRLPFTISHRLNEHPVFRLESIAALCRRLPPHQVVHRFGKVTDDADFDASFRMQPGFTLDDALDHLEERQAYIYISNPETDPQYRPVIEELLGELAMRTEPLDPGMNWYSAYLFVSARDSVTPYHMDREMNFLLQVRGQKTVRLWDPADKDVLRPDEQDLLLSYMSDRRPPYRSGIESKAMEFNLHPGLGVHHPFIAPHLVHTGQEISISLALSFRTRQSDLRTEAHQFNYKLRQFGLKPGPVGRHDAIDRVKAVTIRAIRRARAALRGVKP
jgi:hypothetical protein